MMKKPAGLAQDGCGMNKLPERPIAMVIGALGGEGGGVNDMGC